MKTEPIERIAPMSATMTAAGCHRLSEDLAVACDFRVVEAAAGESGVGGCAARRARPNAAKLAAQLVPGHSNAP